ncbi:MAG TPA: hypothetical protein VFW82_04675 [Dyella sp.]|nr:hypothetical protein [Dyella sp.]
MPRPPADRSGAWYRQPVLWLGIAVFVASMAGCIWIIVIGARHHDVPVDAPRPVFGVPARGHATPAASVQAASASPATSSSAP